MFEFKKNKSSDKVLTEKEIQQKLYGRFLKSTSVAGASEPAAKPAHSQAPAAGAATLFPEDREETSAKPPAETAPQSRPAEKKPEFREAAPFSAGQNREKLRSSEPEAYRTAPKVQPSAKQSVRIEKVKPAFQVDWRKIFDRLADGVVALVRAGSNLFAGASRIVDLRKNSVRTGISWGGGVLVLVLLLIAIHGLNVKREAAMKMAPSKQRQMVKVVKTAPKPKAAEIKAGVPAEAGQAAETTAGILTHEESPLKPAEEGVDGAAEAKKAVPKTEKKDAETAAAKGRFVIQVATYVIKDDAARLMEDLKKSEPRVFIKGLTRASGKTYYSVFIGRFKSFQEAQQAVAGFKKTDLARSFKDAFIRTLDS